MTIKKPSVKQLLSGLLWTTIGLGSIVLLVAAVHRKDGRVCKDVEITISGVSNNFFIDKNDVLKIINRNAGTVAVGKPMEEVNLRRIEAELEKDVWIKNAELFFDNNDVLQADVEEREPVARVFTISGGTFYIDSSSMILPLSDKFSARLPLFTGFTSDAKVLSKPDSALLLDIKELSLQILADSFLMAMIEQVDITPQRNFELLPKIGKQVILFGNASDAAAKFKKLKLFYRNVIMKAGWNRYSSITLQYSNQVVAKIKGKEDIAADSLRTLQLMKLIAENAAKQSADSMHAFAQDNDKNNADTSLIQQSIERDEDVQPAIIDVNKTPDAIVTPAAVAPTGTDSKPPVTKPVLKKPAPVKKPARPPVKKEPKAVMRSNDY